MGTLKELITRTLFYKYDEHGLPVPVEVRKLGGWDMDAFRDWATWTEDHRVVEQTEVAPGVRVSTVFLGTDHSLGLGPPVLWETMVFVEEAETTFCGRTVRVPRDLFEMALRYTSLSEAAAGHRAMCATVMGRLGRD